MVVSRGTLARATKEAVRCSQWMRTPAKGGPRKKKYEVLGQSSGPCGVPGAPGPRGKATRGEELTQEARSDLAVMLWGKVAKSGVRGAVAVVHGAGPQHH